MKALVSLLALPFFLHTGAAFAADPGPGPGVDFALHGQYENVSPPLPTQSAGKVEVVELFWYGCPHCYEFEPHVTRWLVGQPPHVAFVRIPAVFPNNKQWHLHAQAYYTADALGVLDRLHPAMFDAMNKNKRPIDTRERLQGLFAEHGVAEADFNRAWDSFGVQSRVRQAVGYTERSGIDGVPAVIVNGKYRTSGGLTGSYANLLRVVDALVDQEHKAAGPSSTKDAKP
jgi:thiol:disulfide interchange protein DsbA